MFRYIAITTARRDVDVREKIAHMTEGALRALGPYWSVAFRSDELNVLCSGEQDTSGGILRLPGSQGLILGTLFRKTDAEDPRPRVLEVSDRQSILICQSRGRTLIEDYWGSYIAVLKRTADEPGCILRGPMTFFSCFHALDSGIHVFFSRVDDFQALNLKPLTINWKLLKVSAAFKEPRAVATGLNEIDTIEMGEQAEIGATELKRTFFWNPCEIARNVNDVSFEEARASFRATTLKCVHAWASIHPSIILRLSGGVDSSIVLACLKSAPTRPSVTAHHLYSRLPNADERFFARKAVGKTGFPLIERERADDLDLSVILNSYQSPSPLRDYQGFETHSAERELAQQARASVIFSGALGDAVFEQSIDESAASDYVERFGIDRYLFSAIRSIALRREVSIWRVLRFALRHGITPPNRSPWSDYLLDASDMTRTLERQLVTEETSAEAMRSVPDFVHPWFKDVAGIGVNKLWTIASLKTEFSYDEAFSDVGAPLAVGPLASQPLVELSLRTPTYLHARDGWDRAVARHAFSSDLPVEIFTRATKGTPGQWAQRVIRANTRFIREFLLDGALVESGVLDRKKLEIALSNAPSKSSYREMHVLRQLGNEAWLRRWLSKPAARMCA